MSSSKSLPRRNLSVLQLKKSLKGEVDLEVNGWEILGEVMVLDLKEGYSWAERKLIGERIVKLHPKATTVVNRRSIENELREPNVEVIAGNMPETVYSENGVRYKIDPTKVMFSFGNKNERERMGRMSSAKEIVVDMFSCVGQFTIPIAKHSKPKKVYAIEKNPVAYTYLLDNIKLNKLKNVEPLLGDCRSVFPVGVADRIIMGYLFEPEKFLPTALNILNEKGVIHYHFISDSSHFEAEKSKALHIIREKAQKASVSKTIRVKSYSPKKYHWVLDIDIEL